MLRLLELNPQPIECFECVGIGRNGQPRPWQIPVLTALVDGLPDGCDALVVTSDLQYRERSSPTGEPPRLIAIAIAETLALRLTDRLGLESGRCGVLLVGDLFAHPVETGKRGGYGDVARVWDAFADTFGWVAGILGNHDFLGHAPARTKDAATFVPSTWRPEVALIECGTVEIAGLRVAGVSGCVGNPKRPYRYEVEQQVDRLLTAAAADADVLLVHQGPPGSGRARPGAEMVQEVLLDARCELCICGHEHWDTRVDRVGRTTVLNTHEAIIVLIPGSA